MTMRASPEMRRLSEAQRKAKADKWKRPDQRPEYSPDDQRLSISVLMYDKEMDLHGIGWFNFDTESWSSFGYDFPTDDNQFLWTRLPRP